MPVIHRLTRYGLSATAEEPAEPLVIPTNRTMVLDPLLPDLFPHRQQLRYTSILEIKAWLGRPDSAVAAPAKPAYTSLPIQATSNLSAEQHAEMYRAFRGAVFGSTATLKSGLTKAVDEWLAIVQLPVWIWIYTDVVISAGASLVLSNGTILFANDITIEETGKIVAGSFCGIDCSSIVGATPFPWKIPDIAVSA